MLQCTTRWTSKGFLCQLFVVVVVVAQAVGANGLYYSLVLNCQAFNLA